MALPAALGLWICASPCVSHVPSHVPSHVLPRSLPRSGGYATRLLSFAGLQPALPRDPCFISQKCSPAGTCWVASFFRSLSLSITSPGRRPGHRRLRVANPQQRVGVYVWVFSWMCFRVGVYVVANPQQRVGVFVDVFSCGCLRGCKPAATCGCLRWGVCVGVSAAIARHNPAFRFLASLLRLLPNGGGFCVF